MKLSTARRLVCMSYFTVDGLRPLLATATRIVCSGDTKRFLFPDGSVIESNKGNWKVVDMKKNPKLEAAVKRFGAGVTKQEICEHFKVPQDVQHITLNDKPAPFSEVLEIAREQRMAREIVMLNALLNEKDEQLDKASRPMVVRLDMWLVIIAICIAVSRFT